MRFLHLRCTIIIIIIIITIMYYFHTQHALAPFISLRKIKASFGIKLLRTQRLD